ncbi:MAG: TetR family transcriptional regulator [Streptosporangiales bacterium]|nr:TetR family transcriptional regulator [Streptosporangiales bacterium]
MAETREEPGGIRGRFRAQVRSEAKQVALRQLAVGGPQALSINAIGKELGVSGPALYRYFANRDDLLTELVADAYHDLAAALAAATRRARRLRPERRLRAVVAAYRDWARAEPHRYRLLFAAPLPGYDAHSTRLVTASQEAMQVLLDVLADLVPQNGDGGGEADLLDGQLDSWSRTRGLTGVGPTLALRSVMAWSRLHGLVSLEIEGNFASMGLDPDLLFDAEVAALVSPPSQA